MLRTVERQKPLILHEKKHTLKDVENLKKKWPIYQETDIYEQQIGELFEITHPDIQQKPQAYKQEFDRFLKQKLQSTKKGGFAGNWIYFPWYGGLVHMVNEKDYVALRTNRNRNLITTEEQKKLLAAPVGIAGLSIGNAIALSLMHSGISNTIKLAEYDTLETTNLNRLRAKVDQIGSAKLSITMQQLYESNPYADIYTYPKGLRKQMLSSFIAAEPKLRLVFDTIDDFEIKVLMREEAKKQKVPTVMLTSLGDNVLIDIERHDLDAKTKPFNGRVPEDILRKILSAKISNEEKNQYAVAMVGKENVPQQAVESVKQIGKTLVGRPQLMSTVTVASGLASFLARKIILGETLLSGRTLIRFDNFISIKA